MGFGERALRPAQRLRRPRDFLRVSRKGRRLASPSFVVLVAGRCGSPGRSDVRLGLTVSRAVGNAVRRNRVKRLVREWFRASRALLPAGCDVVVIARPAAGSLRSPQVRRELSDLAAALSEKGSA